VSGGILAQAKRLAKAHQSTSAVVIPDDVRGAMGYKPRPIQAALDGYDRRFNVRVLHRRFGKTVREVAKLIERATLCPYPNGRYAYMAPTYGLAEDIAWLYLKDFHGNLMRACGRDPEPLQQQGKLAVMVPTRNGNWSRVRLYGVDSPKQRIRGLYLDGGVGDEWAWIPPSVFNQQVRPMLSDKERGGLDLAGNRNQWFDFIFTPFGRNHAYRLYKDAEAWGAGKPVKQFDPAVDGEVDIYSDEWDARLYKASETGVITPSELASARVSMGPAKFAQEYDCSFDAAVEGAIYAKAVQELRDRGRIGEFPMLPLLPVNTAWDLGYDDATAIWFYQETAGQVRIIDYIEIVGASLERIVEKLAEKNYRYGHHLLPWDVVVGELGTGKTRASILKELGVRVTPVAKPKNWTDRVAAADAMLPLCVFNETTCADGIDRICLYRREYVELNGVYREKAIHDYNSHGADALGTLAMGRRRQRAEGEHDPHRDTHAVM
jgi:phage terminase large subunit